MINIILADDHVLVRKGIRGLLASQTDFNVIAEAGTCNEAIEQLSRFHADVIIVDISMPGRSGFDLIAHVRTVQPQARVIVLTVHTEEEFASRALKAGTHGYITKDASPEQLVTAVREVAAGSSFLSPQIAQSLVWWMARSNDAGPLHSRLTRREFAIFGMLAEGRPATDIARELDLSVKTVSGHKMSILRKLNLRTQSELVRYALQHGLSIDSKTSSERPRGHDTVSNA